MKLRLMEQACAAAARCETEAESRCVLFTASSTRVESACHCIHASTCTDCGLQRSRHASSDLRLLHVYVTRCVLTVQ